MANIRSLTKAVLQISCSQGRVCIQSKKGHNSITTSPAEEIKKSGSLIFHVQNFKTIA